MNSTRRTCPLFFLIALIAVMAGNASAQTDPVRVEQIRLEPMAHVNQIRTVAGVVDRLASRPGAATPSYYLEDDFGHQILVIPVGTPPARGDRVTVTGVVTLDPSGDPVLTLFDANAPAGTPGAAPVGTEQAGSSAAADAGAVDGAPAVAGAGAAGGGPAGGGQAAAPGGPDAVGGAGAQARPAPGPDVGLPEVESPAPDAGGSRLSSPWVRRILIGFGVAFALLLLTGYAFSRGQEAAGTPAPLITAPGVGRKDVDFATSALWPESDQEFDGRTLRFSRPDPTVQLLPGRLEIIGGGDAGEEIRFIAVPGESIEMMFGRSAGEGPRHVQLKHKTVSRTHAVIRNRHGEWLLENLSLTNPTVLNDEILGVKERLLTDGDRIEMGEVVFLFRTS